MAFFSEIDFGMIFKKMYCAYCGELTNYNQQLQYRKEQKKARKKILFLNTKKSKNQKNKTK